MLYHALHSYTNTHACDMHELHPFFNLKFLIQIIHYRDTIYDKYNNLCVKSIKNILKQGQSLLWLYTCCFKSKTFVSIQRIAVRTCDYNKILFP